MRQTGCVSFSIATAAEFADALPSFESATEVWRDNGGVACARGFADGSRAWIELPGLASFRFDRTQWTVTAIPKPDVEEDLVRDNYYRAALPLALQYFGVEVLHASAVQTRIGVVAFCAVSETGKSTTVAALARRGYPAWADDAVPIEVAAGSRGVHALGVPFRLRVAAEAQNAGGGYRWSSWPQAGGLELRPKPLAALCVMRRVNSTPFLTEVRRLTSVEAVTALLPHAYCFTLAESGRKRDMMGRYIEVAARVPTYAVSIRSGLEKLPAALDQIERSIPGFSPPAAA